MKNILLTLVLIPGLAWAGDSEESSGSTGPTPRTSPAADVMLASASVPATSSTRSSGYASTGQSSGRAALQFTASLFCGRQAAPAPAIRRTTQPQQGTVSFAGKEKKEWTVVGCNEQGRPDVVDIEASPEVLAVACPYEDIPDTRSEAMQRLALSLYYRTAEQVTTAADTTTATVNAALVTGLSSLALGLRPRLTTPAARPALPATEQIAEEVD